MAYSANAALQDLFEPGPLERSINRLTRRAGASLTDGVTRRTPVAKQPHGVAAAGDTRDAWIFSRQGRVPGTLKESWETGELERTGPESRAIESYTLDWVGPYVEYDTVPHLIRARLGRFLRYWDQVGEKYRREVHHPGTQGAHMMRDALAALETEWIRLGEEEVDRWAREQVALVR